MMPLRLKSNELRIVCIGAHPDDVEIGCGGTLLSLAASRRTLSATVVVATGSGGRYEAMKAHRVSFPAPISRCASSSCETGSSRPPGVT